MDERILWELLRDGRIPNSALAQRAGISQSTCHTRVRSLWERGVLQSINAQVDFDALGLPLQALVTVRLRAQARTQLQAYARRIVRLANVISIFVVGGPDDFLVHVACTSRHQLQEFVVRHLSSDPAIESTQTNILFDQLFGAHHMDPYEGFAHVRRTTSPD